MQRSREPLGEIILSKEARTILSGEEICQALQHHKPKKGMSTFVSQRGFAVVVITKDDFTRVLLHRP